MHSKQKIFLISIILMMLLSLIICPEQCQSYYGSVFGSRPLYGITGLYGLGGLYGMGLYGLGGLSGLGLYGLGGLYGLSGLYGMGLYGLGGLYGALSSTYMDLMGMGFLLKSLGLLDSSTNISPTANANALSSLIPLSPLSLTGLPVIPSLPVAGIAGTTLLPLYIAEQTGTWVGNWIAVDSTSTAIVTGRMTLDIAEDLLGGVSGFAVLELNAFLGAGVSLNGSISNNIVILQGSVLTSFGPKPLQVDIICTVDTPAHMTGTYQVADYQGGNVKVYELGTFELQLLPALI